MVEDATGTRGLHPPALQWYADRGPRRHRQVAVDVAVGLWLLGWVVVGIVVHRTIAALASPALSVAGSADDGSDRLLETGAALASIPLVGEEVGAPLRAAAATLGRVAVASERTAGLVADLALAIGVLLPLAPVALVLALWLPARLRFARRAGAARTLLAAGADPQLFALRALTTQPLPRLMTVSQDPVGDWRRGDPMVTQALARLELDDLGVSDPGRPDPRPVGPLSR